MTLKPQPHGDIQRNLQKLQCLKSLKDGPVRYELRLINCSNKTCRKCREGRWGQPYPSHGPYWYMLAKSPLNGRTLSIYIGKKLNTQVYRTENGEFNHEQYQRDKDARRAKKEIARNQTSLPASG